MLDETISVVEGNDPLLHFKFTDKVFENGALREKAYDLTGATIEFILKPDRMDADTAPAGDWAILLPAVNGLADLQLDNADLGTPGTQWYRVDIIKSGNRRTFGYGAFVVENG